MTSWNDNTTRMNLQKKSLMEKSKSLDTAWVSVWPRPTSHTPKTVATQVSLLCTFLSKCELQGTRIQQLSTSHLFLSNNHRITRSTFLFTNYKYIHYHKLEELNIMYFWLILLMKTLLNNFQCKTNKNNTSKKYFSCNKK